MMMINPDYKKLIEKVRVDISTYVSEKRLLHTYAVLDTALMLGNFFISIGAEISCEEIELSALLHDMTKYMDQTKLCEKYGIQLSVDDENSPATLHAITGAYFAREKYDVSDRTFSAIKKHTTADVDMTLHDKIIFVSDYCEETRMHEECRKSRKMLLSMMETVTDLKKAEKALDYIIADILAKTIAYINSERRYVHGKTVKAFKHIVSLYSDDKKFRELSEKYSETIQNAIDASRCQQTSSVSER